MGCQLSQSSPIAISREDILVKIVMCSNLLGIPAVKQVVSKLNKSSQDEVELVQKLYKNCVQFDHAGSGTLSESDFFNVLKIQNKVPIEKDELKAIMAPLPRDKGGKIKIDDFFTLDIHSSTAFEAMDKNKDGFITKGEMKLAKKSVPLKDIDKCIKDHDLDDDGMLNLDEFQKSGDKSTA
eukprot:maker-scaffold373_size192110-snap-gene-0.37 protein:Tk03500 transcript:maker-scaffold373_size192110-snap-gene-0.37-mRNA-1 annotation:"hypothetical protein PRUPE_ppa012426mg"